MVTMVSMQLVTEESTKNGILAYFVIKKLGDK